MTTADRESGIALRSDTAGGYLVGTDHLAAEFVELLRNRTLLVQLGGRVLSGLRGNVDIPTQTGAATAYWLGEDDAIMGITRFGESAPYQRIYKEFGLTAENVTKQALELIRPG